eukprot:TRINITY_DN9778_c0_g1_i1.p1 TRINITY_DN9778_c0_g1~~TRINITY_DN9778_c0_g1_i1.p1  ORF type:complete len:677 (+),score=112.92 TRINITY_DN9778_c0_g1_i1:262-2292(+)
MGSSDGKGATRRTRSFGGSAWAQKRREQACEGRTALLREYAPAAARVGATRVPTRQNSFGGSAWKSRATARDEQAAQEIAARQQATPEVSPGRRGLYGAAEWREKAAARDALQSYGTPPPGRGEACTPDGRPSYYASVARDSDLCPKDHWQKGLRADGDGGGAAPPPRAWCSSTFTPPPPPRAGAFAMPGEGGHPASPRRSVAGDGGKEAKVKTVPVAAASPASQDPAESARREREGGFRTSVRPKALFEATLTAAVLPRRGEGTCSRDQRPEGAAGLRDIDKRRREAALQRRKDAAARSPATPDGMEFATPRQARAGLIPAVPPPCVSPARTAAAEEPVELSGTAEVADSLSVPPESFNHSYQTENYSQCTAPIADRTPPPVPIAASTASSHTLTQYLPQIKQMQAAPLPAALDEVKQPATPTHDPRTPLDDPQRVLSITTEGAETVDYLGCRVMSGVSVVASVSTVPSGHRSPKHASIDLAHEVDVLRLENARLRAELARKGSPPQRARSMPDTEGSRSPGTAGQQGVAVSDDGEADSDDEEKKSSDNILAYGFEHQGVQSFRCSRKRSNMRMSRSRLGSSSRVSPNLAPEGSPGAADYFASGKRVSCIALPVARTVSQTSPEGSLFDITQGTAKTEDDDDASSSTPHFTASMSSIRAVTTPSGTPKAEPEDAD